MLCSTKLQGRPCLGQAKAQLSTRCSVVACSSKKQSSSTAPHLAAAVASAIVLGFSGHAWATGLESVDLLTSLESISTPDEYRASAARESAKLKAADENFEKSDTLKRLLEQSEANRERNKKAIANKYCMRQAEIGVGDCGGLRFIPGMTDNGKQRTPDWLSDLLGVERAPPESDDTLTLKKLFSDEPVAP